MLLLVALLSAGDLGMAAGSPVLAYLGPLGIVKRSFEDFLEREFTEPERKEIEQDPRAREQALEAYLNERALEAKARQLGLHQSAAYRKAVELWQRRTLAQRVMEEHRASLLRARSVTEEVLRHYYAEHAREFQETPRFTAHHLLVYTLGNPAFPKRGMPPPQALARVGEARAHLAAGESWQSVARQFSDDVGTRLKGGLIRDGRFGIFAPALEDAARSQPLGVLGAPIRSEFGYHLLEVESRVLQGQPRPFESVRAIIRDRIQAERHGSIREELMAPFWSALDFRKHQAADVDANLMDEGAVRPDELLATVAGAPIRESDFQWFLRDALLPQQRAATFGRPGARRALVDSFLDQWVLALAARGQGLDHSPDYARELESARTHLLVEFLLKRDRQGPFARRGVGTSPSVEPAPSYLRRIREEVGLRRVASPDR